MDGTNGQLVVCQICGRSAEPGTAVPAGMLRPPILAALRAEHPDLDAAGFVCSEDRRRARARLVEVALEEEKGELSSLEREVVASLREQETLARNVHLEAARGRSLGERVADRLAEYGGSWGFLAGFSLFLLAWMATNVWLLAARAFDPYPFILLNLILSCLAAVQAPVIMMSQRRQEARDRLRAENDYRVNLKAELEIRHLHAKLDLLLTHQWKRLLEIQDLQVDLMEEIGGRLSPPAGATQGSSAP